MFFIYVRDNHIIRPSPPFHLCMENPFCLYFCILKYDTHVTYGLFRGGGCKFSIYSLHFIKAMLLYIISVYSQQIGNKLQKKVSKIKSAHTFSLSGIKSTVIIRCYLSIKENIFRFPIHPSESKIFFHPLRSNLDGGFFLTSDKYYITVRWRCKCL